LATGPSTSPVQTLGGNRPRPRNRCESVEPHRTESPPGQTAQPLSNLIEQPAIPPSTPSSSPAGQKPGSNGHYVIRRAGRHRPSGARTPPDGLPPTQGSRAGRPHEVAVWGGHGGGRRPRTGLSLSSMTNASATTTRSRRRSDGPTDQEGAGRGPGAGGEQQKDRHDDAERGQGDRERVRRDLADHCGHRPALMTGPGARDWCASVVPGCPPVRAG
jgi:hypothetical protein